MHSIAPASIFTVPYVFPSSFNFAYLKYFNPIPAISSSSPSFFRFAAFRQKLNHFGARPLPKKSRSCPLTACKRAVFTWTCELPTFCGSRFFICIFFFVNFERELFRATTRKNSPERDNNQSHAQTSPGRYLSK